MGRRGVAGFSCDQITTFVRKRASLRVIAVRQYFTLIAFDVARHPQLTVSVALGLLSGVVKFDVHMSYQGQRGPPQASEHQQHSAFDGAPMDNSRYKRSDQQHPNHFQNVGTPTFSPSASPGHLPDRTPTRASTLGSAKDLDRSNMSSQHDLGYHAKSEDLNHGGSSSDFKYSNGAGSLPSPSPAFMNSSRPNTPPTQRQGSNSGHSEHSNNQHSMVSHSSTYSESSQSGMGKGNDPSSSSVATTVASS